MKKFTFILTMFLSLGAFAQPFTELTTPTTKSFLSIYFVNDNIGYASGENGLILKTTDGTTWSTQNTGVTSTINDIIFENMDTGYATGLSGTIIRTINGGKSWQKLTSGVSADLKRINIYNGIIYISGNGGTLIKSSDHGSNWSKLKTGSTTFLYSITFTSADTGYLVGENTILKTTNGGNSWNALTNPYNSGMTYQNVYFINSINGFIVGGDFKSKKAIILKTKDAGLSWDTTTYANDYFGNIRFLDQEVGYIVGGDPIKKTCTILKTMDGGGTWVNQKVNFTRQFAASFPSKNVGYTAGVDGSILKTVNITTDIKEVSETSLVQVNIYPNPTSSKLNFSINGLNTNNATVHILDAMGRKVSSQKYQKEIDISNLSKGVYFINVVVENNSYTNRIVKL